LLAIGRIGKLGGEVDIARLVIHISDTFPLDVKQQYDHEISIFLRGIGPRRSFNLFYAVLELVLTTFVLRSEYVLPFFPLGSRGWPRDTTLSFATGSAVVDPELMLVSGVR
jgi:hypothetical protein